MVQRNLFITIMTILNLALQIAVPQDDMLSTAGQIENISLNNTWRRSDLSWEEWPDYYCLYSGVKTLAFRRNL